MAKAQNCKNHNCGYIIENYSKVRNLNVECSKFQIIDIQLILTNVVDQLISRLLAYLR